MIEAEHPHAVPRNGFFLKKGPLRQNLSHLPLIKCKKFEVSKMCVQALYGYSVVSQIDFFSVDFGSGSGFRAFRSRFPCLPEPLKCRKTKSFSVSVKGI